MAFAFSVFAISALFSLLALFLYFPLLCVIRGNLKEFCCHKIDKRIGEMLRKKSRMRVAREARLRMMEKGDIYERDLKNSLSLREPTLPAIPPDLEDLYEFEGSLPGYGQGRPNTRSVNGRNRPVVPQRSTSGATFRSAGSVWNQSYASTAPTYFSRQASTVRSSPGHSEIGSPKIGMDYTRPPSPQLMQRYPSKASSVASSSATVTYASRLASSLANTPTAPVAAHTAQRRPTFTNFQPRSESPHSYTHGVREAETVYISEEARPSPLMIAAEESISQDSRSRSGTRRQDSEPDRNLSSVPPRTSSPDSSNAIVIAPSPTRSKRSMNDVRNNEIDETFKSHHIFSPTSPYRPGPHPFGNAPHRISFTNDPSISFSFGNASVVDDTRTVEASAISYLNGDPFTSMEASIIHNNISITPPLQSPTTVVPRFFPRKSPTGQSFPSTKSSQRESRFVGRDAGWSDGEELTPRRYRERKRTLNASRGDYFMTGYGVDGSGSNHVALGVNF